MCVLCLAGLVCGVVASDVLHGLVGQARGATPVRLEAHFARSSYVPGEAATLTLAGATRVTVQLYACGSEALRTSTTAEMHGLPVADPLTTTVRGGRLKIDLRYWPSGLYFARVTDGVRLAFAPFVLRAAPLWRSRVAVVLPTYTWQAYNKRDDDGDGLGDSWYARDEVTTISLNRPYLHRGVPPHFRGYDLGFIRWLARTNKRADFLADEDIERIASGTRLALAYDLIVFSGHEEYVTAHTFDLISRYRDAGGNLAFLSANNFFYRVVRQGSMIVGRERWRDLGRSEAALMGVEYVGWNRGVVPNAPYVVTGATAAPWLFAGTGLHNGSQFGVYGIEIDQRAYDSPPGTRTLATIKDMFGPGQSAEMTYYTTPAGAKVFAAGVINFGGSAMIQPVPQLLQNLWSQLTVP